MTRIGIAWGGGLSTGDKCQVEKREGSYQGCGEEIYVNKRKISFYIMVVYIKCGRGEGIMRV